MAEAARALPIRIAPQPGPQMMLAQCEADIGIYGGGAGGGKTYGLLYDGGKWCHVPRFTGVVFRRTSPQLTGPGGIWEESHTIYRPLGGRPRGGNTLDWRWDTSARIQFRHLQRDEDRFAHQGAEYAYIAFDELTHFTEVQFWYLIGRLRSTCGVRPYCRASCNPDPDSWVYPLIAWWIDEDGYPIPERAGVLRWFVRDPETSALHWYDSEAEAKAEHPGSSPMSLTFIPSLITDNPALLDKDPTAIAKLEAQNRVDRARLLRGNWKVRDAAGVFFRRSDFRRASEPPSPIVASWRAWDKAATPEGSAKNPRPDWTRGVRMHLCERGEIWIDDAESLRAGPVEVLQRMRRTAERDGMSVTVVLWQETGQAGIVDVQTTITALGSYPVEVVLSSSADTEGMAKKGYRSSRAKRAFARVWAPWVEQGRVYIARDVPWADALLAEADLFPDGTYDDFIDAISAGAQVLGRERGTSLLEAMAGVDL